MTNIHWLGTGLSAIPGLKMLIENGHSVLVYNRTVEKAIKALSNVKGDYQVFVYSDVNPADQTPDNPSSTTVVLEAVNVADNNEIYDMGTIYIDKY